MKTNVMFDYESWVAAWIADMGIRVPDITQITLTIDEQPFLLKQLDDNYLMAVGLGPVPCPLSQGQALLLLQLNGFNARTQPLQVGIVNGGDLVMWIKERWEGADLSARYDWLIQTAADLRKEME